MDKNSPVALIDVQAHRQSIGREIDDNIAAVVDHGKWIMGPEVAEFEFAAAEYVGAEQVQAIGCSNGTDALVLAMQAMGLPRGSAVICPAFTFVATAESIAALGGRPVFADVDPDGFNLSAESVRQAATAAVAEGLEIAGVCAVDLFGEPARYDELKAVCDEFGCWLLADGAQGFGGAQNGVKVGALASVTTTSFFPAKPLGCYGDGGMVFTTDDAIADVIRSLRVHGKGTDKYDNVRIGQNSRLDTLQAAILLPKLAILDNELAGRDRVAARYEQALANVPGVSTPKIRSDSKSAWAQYTLITDKRNELQSALIDNGIGCAVYYPKPLHWQTGYKHFHLPAINLERTEWLTSRVLSIPMYPYLEDVDIDRVADVVRTAVTR